MQDDPGIPTGDLAPERPRRPERGDRVTLVAVIIAAAALLVIAGLVVTASGDDDSDDQRSAPAPRPPTTSTVPTTTSTTAPPTTTTTIDPEVEALYGAMPAIDELEFLLGSPDNGGELRIESEPAASTEYLGSCATATVPHLAAASLRIGDDNWIVTISVLKFASTETARQFMAGKLAPRWAECVIEDERIASLEPTRVTREERVADGPKLAVGVEITGSLKESPTTTAVMTSRQVGPYVIDVLAIAAPPRNALPGDDPTFDLAFVGSITDLVEGRLPG